MKPPFSSLLLLCFVVFPVVLEVERVSGCPIAPNVTLEQLFEGNPHLKALYNEFEPLGFLSTEGLRSLMTRLFLRTACPPLAEEAEHHDHEDEHHGDEHHNHGDHDHSDHDHHHEALNMKEKLVEPWSLDKGNEHTSNHHSEAEETEPPLRGKTNMQPDEDASLGTKDCDPVKDVISKAGFKEDSSSLSPESFLYICPSILNSLLKPPCQRKLQDESGKMDHLSSGDHDHDHEHDHSDHSHGYDHSGHNHHHRHAKDDVTQMTRDAWIAAILSMVLIGLIALMCIMVIPILKKSKYYVVINHFLLALAIGSLAGDALIHLLPHAMTMEIQMGLSGHLVHALYGFTSFLGILLFLLMERLHNLVGHKHSHSHGSPATVDGDELIKEIGIISAELNEPPAQHFDKIGEKLSQHSKHSSFIFADATSPTDAPRNCFESCPPKLGTGMEDANGNSGSVMDPMVCKPRAVDHNSASLAERERLVSTQPREKNEQISSSKTPLTPIPPPPLVQNSPPKNLVRQDSKNFNMVLQEYHIGHHGHSHHGHSHVTGKKDSLRTMILLGDGMHTFMDGMAIGAAFGTSLTGGIATAIAVLCHELPHKVGDFAILFEMGMRRRQAVKMVLLLWGLSLTGLAVGVSIGSIKEVSPWIYCFTAGVFLYLALVDLLSELSINTTEPCSAGTQMALQVAGMLTGAGIMLVIAIYEHDLEYLLEGTF